jgi:cation diffusion facilitator family transporter
MSAVINSESLKINRQAAEAAEKRNRKITRTSIVGITANVMLAAFKAVIGVATNSIAITLDAVNNLSDAASSVITIIGTKLAGRPADKKHPFGYGRVEYLSAMIISLIVLYAGVTSFTESVKKIITPEKPDYSTISLVIVAVAVLVKIFLGRYVKKIGEEVNSDSLVNSGEDAKLDSVISASTLAAAAIYLMFDLSLESWLGAVISVVIIKSGVEMLRDTLSQILGERADINLAKEIKKTVMEVSGVSGVYDLVLNNYGPDQYNGSLHVELPDTYTADRIDEILRDITKRVYIKHNVMLTAIGIYSVNTKNDRAVRMRDDIYKTALANPYVLQAHGFYLYENEKTIRFDIIVSFDAEDRFSVFDEIVKEVQSKYPEYTVLAVMDTDFSESQ